MRYAILVVWADGEQEYLKDGNRQAIFSSKKKATEMRDFMVNGMSEEAQSINVVKAPASGREARA